MKVSESESERSRSDNLTALLAIELLGGKFDRSPSDRATLENSDSRALRAVLLGRLPNSDLCKALIERLVFVSFVI